MTRQEIIAKLPYSSPFLFVDELIEVSETTSRGCYTFKEEAFFYKGHFKNKPVTPGVILTEVMAQIGVVCMGVYLLREELTVSNEIAIALTSSQIDLFLPVFPNEKVTVVSEKQYFRFNKLKCNVQLFNEKEELVCRGTISGMIANEK